MEERVYSTQGEVRLLVMGPVPRARDDQEAGIGLLSHPLTIALDRSVVPLAMNDQPGNSGYPRQRIARDDGLITRAHYPVVQLYRVGGDE